MVIRTYGSDTDTIRENAPKRTSEECEQLVGKAKIPDSIADAILGPDEVCDDEGYGGVDEHKESDGKRADKQQICRDLNLRRGEHCGRWG